MKVLISLLIKKMGLGIFIVHKIYILNLLNNKVKLNKNKLKNHNQMIIKEK